MFIMFNKHIKLMMCILRYLVYNTILNTQLELHKELHIRDILFLSNRKIHKSSFEHCFWPSDLIDFTKIFQLKGLEAKNKIHMNIYECFGLTKKCI